MTEQEIFIMTEQVLQNLLGEWLIVAGTLVAGLVLKDFAANLAVSLSFYFDKKFNAGDVVYIDDEKATIVTIGIRNTTFQIESEKGTTWRVVPNDRIKHLKLEKIINT